MKTMIVIKHVLCVLFVSVCLSSIVAVYFYQRGIDIESAHAIQLKETYKNAVEDERRRFHGDIKLFNTLSLNKDDHQYTKEEYEILTDKRLNAIIEKSNPNLNNNERDTYLRYIRKNAKRTGVSPIFIASIIHRETNYRKHIVSSVGAKGCMQVYAKYHKEKLKKYNIAEKDLVHIKYGILVGSDIIKEYLTMSDGNYREALYRYVGGKHRKYVSDIFDMCKYAYDIKL